MDADPVSQPSVSTSTEGPGCQFWNLDIFANKPFVTGTFPFGGSSMKFADGKSPDVSIIQEWTAPPPILSP